MRTFNRPALIAGPWLSELGWELMVWQAAVRFQRMRRSWREVFVITFPGREPLYEDCKIVTHAHPFKKASFGIGRVTPDEVATYVLHCTALENVQPPYRIFTPNHLFSFKSRLLQKLFKYGLKHRSFRDHQAPIQYDIAFHFRSFQREGDPVQKELDRLTAEKLVRWCLKQNLRVCCIGLPGYSFVPEGAENEQSVNLAQTIETLNRAQIVVGGSSAPMHLAHLCEKPVVVWTGPPFTAERYFKSWNPFRSPVYVVSEQTFNPTLKDIIRGLEIMLSDTSKDSVAGAIRTDI